MPLAGREHCKPCLEGLPHHGVGEKFRRRKQQAASSEVREFGHGRPLPAHVKLIAPREVVVAGNASRDQVTILYILGDFPYHVGVDAKPHRSLLKSAADR